MRVLRLLCLVLAVVNLSLAQCPWHKDVPDLQTACLCAYNLGHELSVQCDQVRYTKLYHLFIARNINWNSSITEFTWHSSFALLLFFFLGYFSTFFLFLSLSLSMNLG